MRTSRKLSRGAGCYHVFFGLREDETLPSFTVSERRTLSESIEDAARFTGIELEYVAIRPRYVDLLTRVPPSRRISDRELTKRLRAFAGDAKADDVAARLASRTMALQSKQATRRTYTSRMGDLAYLLKYLKQRFARNYNAAHGLDGSPWHDRYRSGVVQDDPAIRLAVSTAIERHSPLLPRGRRVLRSGETTLTLAIKGDSTSRERIRSLTGARTWPAARRRFEAALRQSPRGAASLQHGNVPKRPYGKPRTRSVDGDGRDRDARGGERWERMFEAVAAFTQAGGVICCGQPPSAEERLWISSQRLAFGQGKLSSERRQRLEAIGVSMERQWRRNGVSGPSQGDVMALAHPWMTHYEQLKQLAPSLPNVWGYGGIPAEHASLRLWLRTQRRDRCKGTLHPKREALLDELGIVWEGAKRRTSWQEYYEQLKRVAEEYPDVWASGGIPGRFPSLGKWLSRQRTERRKGTLRAERESLLDDLGIVWALPPRRRRP